MDKPTLLVIAGCNGSEKSSFSKAFTTKVIPFDYDKVYLEKFNSLIPTDFRDVMAHNLAKNNLKEAVTNAITTRSNFCDETNFNSTPLYWSEIYKKASYRIELAFFCLNSIVEAKSSN